MGRHSALYVAMSAWRRGPGDIRAADLPDGDSTDPSGLAALLAAAAAPPLPAELAGEGRAVADFLRVRRQALPRRDGVGGSVARRRISRAVTAKAAAAAAVLLVGGSAFATESGRLPAGTQQRVHDALPFLAPPARSRATQGTSATGPGQGPVTTSPSPSALPPASPFPATSPNSARLASLCRAWRDAGTGGPHATPMPTADLAELVAAAGSDQHLASFCAHVLASASPDKPAKSPRIAQTSTNGQAHANSTGTAHRSDNTNGNPNGNGRWNGNWSWDWNGKTNANADVSDNGNANGKTKPASLAKPAKLAKPQPAKKH
jgi:hypothetical protein